MAKVANLEVDAKSYWLYTNDPFDKGKEPFWQQAYTNLVKFIILLHKIAYDYVTLFDVYECPINPELLEKRIAEAEDKLVGKPLIFLSPAVDADRVIELQSLGFEYDHKLDLYKVTETAEVRDALRKLGVEGVPGPHIDKTPEEVRKLDQLAAVKRWFYNDWRRIEPKL